MKNDFFPIMIPFQIVTVCNDSIIGVT